VIDEEMCIEHWWNDTDRGKDEVPEEKIVSFSSFAINPA